MQRKTWILGLMMACGTASASSAFGATITIYNTGQAAGGTALAAGASDPHYALISAPAGTPLTATATSPNGAWTANTATADWISPGSSGGTSWAVGNYDYETTFSLAGDDPTTALLTGLWAADNSGCIFLNGANTGDCVTGFSSLSAFSVSSGFIAGTNTLDFVVTNTGGPTGLFAEVSGTASPSAPPPVPEPSSWVLGLTGALGAGRAIRRRFGSRPIRWTA